MTSLPTPGSDNGTWGSELNTWLGVSMNSDGTLKTSAVTTALGGSGSVTSVTAGDASVVVGGSGSAPTVETGTLDQVANLHPAAANWSNNSKKITNLANGTASSDAAAFGQTLGGGSGLPMTAAGDIVFMNATPAPARLPVGSNGQVLILSAGLPTWGNSPSGFSNPMTTANDMIVGTTGGAAARLAVGATNGDTLQVVNGNVAWAAAMGTPLGGPSGTHPTMFQQPDGSIVVVPLSFYSLSGDDSTWINTAFALLPSITGGSGSYGGTYNGPWTIGTVRLLPADYTITTGILLPNNAGATINLRGHGPGTRLFVGASATAGVTSHVTMGGPQAGVPAQQHMGTIDGLHIDGTNAAAGAAGIEIGGGWGRHIDVACVNFQGAGSMGAHFVSKSNSPSEWMEKCRVTLDLLQNSIGMVIENTSGNANSSSFEYNTWDIYCIMTNSSTHNGPAVLLQGGAYLSGNTFRLRGNMPVNSGPALSIQGNDGAGTNSAIYHSVVQVTMESASTVSGAPQTINLGTNNSLVNCTGILSFQFGNWTAAHIPAGNLLFGGVVFEQGQTALTTANAKPQGWL